MVRQLFSINIEEKIEVFHKVFDNRADLLAVTLRGHMMIEDRLHHIISVGLADYMRPIGKQDIFTFGTATRIAQAIVGNYANQELWKGVMSLNSLRNAVGHRLQPKKLEALLISFFNDTYSTASKIFKSDVYYNPKGESEETHAIAIRVRCMALWATLGMHADSVMEDFESILSTRRK